VQYGKRIGAFVLYLLHYQLLCGLVLMWPGWIRSITKVLLQPEAVIGIVGSTNHRFRVLTVFRRV
jgi:hypothetical protein